MLKSCCKFCENLSEKICSKSLRWDPGLRALGAPPVSRRQLLPDGVRGPPARALLVDGRRHRHGPVAAALGA